MDTQLDIYRIASKSLRYFILGLAITMLLVTVPEHRLSVNEILVIAVATSLVYGIIDIQYICFDN